jgi:hypothetical protein
MREKRYIKESRWQQTVLPPPTRATSRERELGNTSKEMAKKHPRRLKCVSHVTQSAHAPLT